MASAQIEIQGKTVGKITIDEKRGISLSKELGFYRLKITASIEINTNKGINEILSDILTSPVIFGDIRLNLTLNNTKNIGCAFPEKSVWLKSNEDKLNSREFCFFVDLEQKTIDAIEEIRAGIKDLVIICRPEGVLFSEDVYSPRISNDLICRELRITIAQSDWCKILTDCGYCETILIEVKISSNPNSYAYKNSENLRELNKNILLGSYGAAVVDCRKILENIILNWSNIKDLKKECESEKDEKKWSQELRIYKYSTMLKKITHLAPHGDEVASKAKWDRKLARMITGANVLLLQWLDQDYN